MKGLIKIITRYLGGAVAVAMIILLLNMVLFLWVANSEVFLHGRSSVEQLSKDLIRENGTYKLSKMTEKTIIEQNQWAILIDDEGKVVWSYQLPKEIPLQYTPSDIAVLTRWYLKDYPVYTWKHADGLIVLGYPKNSIWKNDMEYPLGLIQNAPFFFVTFLLANIAAAFLLAFLFAFRLFRSLNGITKGINHLTGKQPVILSTRGLLGDLADRINQASRRLIRQEEELNKRDTARTTWIAGISHDIRTPLSIAMGYAGQWETDLELSEERREQAAAICRQCERIKTLVNDLNLTSKLEYEMQPLRLEVLYLAPLLRTIAVDFLNEIPENYQLELSIPNQVQNISLEGDMELLKRAISNLVINSMKHNPKGCQITITLESDKQCCTIGVSDDGVGFTGEMLHKLNQKEISVELNTHGLGLILVRQIVKAHHGVCQFLNREEGGCRIFLCLPIQSKPE